MTVKALMRAGCEVVKSLLLSPMAWLCGLALSGGAFITAGVAAVAGLGPALIVAGAFQLLLAGLIRKGLN